MIGAQKIHIVVDIGQLALSEKKGGITRQRLVQEIDRLEIILRSQSTKAGRQKQSLGASVKIERGEVGRRSLLDRFLLVRRQFRLQLLGDRLCDLALDREHVIHRSIVVIRPLVRIRAGIDQLRVHSHFVAGALDTAFKDVSHSELLCDLTQVARDAALVLHHRGAADHLQIGHLC